KLAGFKSFVDPTTVILPGNLSAVVGPNGCGKSNIIDAVRWVMGESSAKQLRGENLTDVIFNGSNSRKPTAIASIELIFDNSDGRIGGEYAAYAEIAIRRQVTREAQSTYFLNGQKCRRRDILDIFLGTGFGPRSYSIIEQGMISQLVEAKPEELRVYLEEAAGISKYKERRRETENRIKHTRENLARVTDIREELAKQLDRLERQAKAAERYTVLKAEEQKLTAELFSIRRKEVAATLGAVEARVTDLGLAFDKAQTDQGALDTAIEGRRQQHADHSDRFNSVQGHFYKFGADIARVEEAIAFNAERVAQLEMDLAAARERSAETARQLAQDDEQIEAFRRDIEALTPELTAVTERDEAHRQALETVEASYRRWQDLWDEFTAAAAGNERTAEVQASRMEHLTALLARLTARLAQLDGDVETLPIIETEHMDSLARDIHALESDAQAAESAIDECMKAIAANREEVLRREDRLDQARGRVQTLRHELASAQALQQAALGREDKEAADFIDAYQLQDAARLGEHLAVVSGWEQAVELVLAPYLQALQVDDAAAFATALTSLEAGTIALVDARSDTAVAEAAPNNLPALASLVRQGQPDSVSAMQVGTLLHGVYAASSIEDALAARSALRPGQSIVTRDGLWLGPDWLRVRREQSSDAGIIARAQEIETLTVNLEDAEAELATRQRALVEARAEVEQAEERRATLQQQARGYADQLAQLRTDHGVRRVQKEEAEARRQRVAAERIEIEGQITQESAALETARVALAEARTALDGQSEERATLVADREQLEAQLEQARALARDSRDEFHRVNANRQRFESGLNASVAAKERLVEQQRTLTEQEARLVEGIEASSRPQPELKAELESKLAERTRIEATLTEVRRELEGAEHAIRELEQQRGELQAQVEEARSAVEAARLERQSLIVNEANLREQIEATGHEVRALEEGLPEEATAVVWEDELAKVDRRIQRLGPINLAAIDEYDSQSERKVYLDQQNDDLEQALETLVDAIRKIDRETRSRFKETFETVNTRLGELFPKVFGGGHAYLELTGEDLLDTGVSLMARPPGKRNASIHLLSGGEKAMTAVALIFAIFHLNPSPVCLLDEVDAPLDDSNTTRFAELIREMSEDVQFVVITHNKITMEMADHLMGVTMHEAGVSRLVSVDVEEAAAMAAM
ncbi:MAG: chromosome segregation protein SMC, partial [Pseudomonadota bacterium]